MVMGILVGVLLLFGIAGGGGWFAYKRYYSKAAPLPSPSPMVQFSPSPAPTVETVAEPGNDAGTNTAEVKETPSHTDPEPGTPSKQIGGTKNQPPRTTTSSQPPAQPKAPPKGKPKDERTVILQ